MALVWQSGARASTGNRAAAAERAERADEEAAKLLHLRALRC
jgi:hypothetical protein